MGRLDTISWDGDRVRIVDQTLLPGELTYCYIDTIEGMHEAIKVLKVRGAPAIGVAAAFGLYLGIRLFSEYESTAKMLDEVDQKAAYLASARPTAVNLFWALDRMKKHARSKLAGKSVAGVKQGMLSEAKRILDEDQEACRKIGLNGFTVLERYSTLLTHCNAGGLATAGYGTALAPIYIAREKGKIFSVYADETRPLLQGARITAFELREAGIPVTLICDSMAAVVMAQKKVDAVIVGADRIAANGDTANKIGTYMVSLCAKAHGIPLFVAAPLSTFDPKIASGKEIPIEERNEKEILFSFGTQVGPEGVKVFNPAFDVTPASLITAIITDAGVLYPPFTDAIAELFRKTNPDCPDK